MRWFASKSHTEETPVVRTILATMEGDAGTADRKEVILFIRPPGEPYTCCGRVRAASKVEGR